MTRDNLKYNKKVKCDGPTDRQTDKACCRVACARLKMSLDRFLVAVAAVDKNLKIREHTRQLRPVIPAASIFCKIF